MFGKKVSSVSGEMLRDEIHAHNTFENPEKVMTEKVEGIIFKDDKLEVMMPACCVMHLIVE